MTVIEELRRDRDEAATHLKEVKARHLKRWKGEKWTHFFKRMHRHRLRRKRVRHILEGYEARIEDAIERKQERKEDKRDDYDRNGGGIVPFDSTVDGVVEWIAYELTEARKHGWTGQAFSGYRSPAKSIAICISMCGAPSCPGRCAGASSNHAKSGYLGGAADITNPTQFEEIANRLGLRLHNNLPADLPHMSATGY
jgi:hypothetical protein